jgi:hypothetical protein
MPEIRLTQGRVAVVDEQDFAGLSALKWMASCKRGKWYACRFVRSNGQRKPEYMARVILAAPPDRFVDHINGDTLDNRRANLRLCTHAENQRNRHDRRSASGFRGVRRIDRNPRRPWVAEIQVLGRKRHLGYFESAEAAACAYDAAAAEHFGAFASPNFVAPVCR